MKNLREIFLYTVYYLIFLFLVSLIFLFFGEDLDSSVKFVFMIGVYGKICLLGGCDYLFKGIPFFPVLIILPSIILFVVLKNSKSELKFMNLLSKHLKLIIIFLLVILFAFMSARALKFTSEENQHNMSGVKGNRVFLQKDEKGGCKEVVFDSKSKPVTSPENKPSYNYYCYYEKPIRHFFVDTLPWLFLGNAKDDSTSFFERLVAFSKDFIEGLLTSIF